MSRRKRCLCDAFRFFGDAGNLRIVVGIEDRHLGVSAEPFDKEDRRIGVSFQFEGKWQFRHLLEKAREDLVVDAAGAFLFDCIGLDDDDKGVFRIGAGECQRSVFGGLNMDVFIDGHGGPCRNDSFEELQRLQEYSGVDGEFHFFVIWR